MTVEINFKGRHHRAMASNDDRNNLSKIGNLRNWNGLNNHASSKIVADKMAENKVADITSAIYNHLKENGPMSGQDTKNEVSNFLKQKGLHGIKIEFRVWQKQKEADFYIKFSFDGTIVENTKITRPVTE